MLVRLSLLTVLGSSLFSFNGSAVGSETAEKIAQRTFHLRVAAEHLKLADEKDLAHKLLEKADALEHDTQEPIAGKQPNATPAKVVESSTGTGTDANTKAGVVWNDEIAQSLWDDLYGQDPAASTAVLKFYQNANRAVPFFREKLQPLKLDPNQCRALIKELGDEKEEVWKAAWDKLDYLDPRLAIELRVLMNEVHEPRARNRLVELCSQRKADSLAGKTVMLSGGDNSNFFDGRGSWWAEHKIDRLGKYAWQPKWAWLRASRAVAILEQIGTDEAIVVLEQLAEGHPEAAPTCAAKESLARLKKQPQ